MQSVSEGQSFRKLSDGLHAGRTLAGAGLLRPHRPDRTIRATLKVVGKFASTGIRVAFDPQSYISGQAASDE